MVDNTNMNNSVPAQKKIQDNNAIRKAIIWALVLAVLAFVLTIVLIILDASTKSSGQFPVDKTPLRLAASAVKSEQTGMEIDNFKGISMKEMSRQEPDLKWQSEPLDSKSESNTVQFLNSGDSVRLANRSAKDICYFVELHSNDASLYGSSEPNENDECDAKTATIDEFTQSKGWNK